MSQVPVTYNDSHDKFSKSSDHEVSCKTTGPTDFHQALNAAPHGGHVSGSTPGNNGSEYNTQSAGTGGVQPYMSQGSHHTNPDVSSDLSNLNLSDQSPASGGKYARDSGSYHHQQQAPRSNSQKTGHGAGSAPLTSNDADQTGAPYRSSDRREQSDNYPSEGVTQPHTPERTQQYNSDTPSGYNSSNQTGYGSGSQPASGNAGFTSGAPHEHSRRDRDSREYSGSLPVGGQDQYRQSDSGRPTGYNDRSSEAPYNSSSHGRGSSAYSQDLPSGGQGQYRGSTDQPSRYNDNTSGGQGPYRGSTDQPNRYNDNISGGQGQYRRSTDQPNTYNENISGGQGQYRSSTDQPNTYNDNISGDQGQYRSSNDQPSTYSTSTHSPHGSGSTGYGSGAGGASGERSGTPYNSSTGINTDGHSSENPSAGGQTFNSGVNQPGNYSSNPSGTQDTGYGSGTGNVLGSGIGGHSGHHHGAPHHSSGHGHHSSGHRTQDYPSGNVGGGNYQEPSSNPGFNASNNYRRDDTTPASNYGTGGYGSGEPGQFTGSQTGAGSELPYQSESQTGETGPYSGHHGSSHPGAISHSGSGRSAANYGQDTSRAPVNDAAAAAAENASAALDSTGGLTSSNQPEGYNMSGSRGIHHEPVAESNVIAANSARKALQDAMGGNTHASLGAPQPLEHPAGSPNVQNERLPGGYSSTTTTHPEHARGNPNYSPGLDENYSSTTVYPPS